MFATIKDMFEHPARYNKFFAGLAGAVLTWALATFPESRNVQLYGSLLSALLTGSTVYGVANRGE